MSDQEQDPQSQAEVKSEDNAPINIKVRIVYLNVTASCRSVC